MKEFLVLCLCVFVARVGAVCMPLGPVTNLSLYVSHDVSANGFVLLYGAAAIGGNLNISGYLELYNGLNNPFSLAVGGNINANPGTLDDTGTVLYGGSFTGNLKGGSIFQVPNLPIYFSSTTAYLKALSTYWSNLTATGSASLSGSYLTLTCNTLAKVQVIPVHGSFFANAATILLEGCNSDMSVIVNVMGTSVSLAPNLNDIEYGLIIYNLFQAVDLSLSNWFPQTILAPFAAAYSSNLNYGSGPLYVDSLYTKSDNNKFGVNVDNEEYLGDFPGSDSSEYQVGTPLTFTGCLPVEPCDLSADVFQDVSSVSLYTSQDANLGGDSYGPVVVGGNLLLTGGSSSVITIEARASETPELAVVVLGDIIVEGTLQTIGTVIYAGSLTGSVLVLDNSGSVEKGSLTGSGFPSVDALLKSLSSSWATFSATGNSSFSWSTITLTCGPSALQVIYLPGSYFTSGFYLEFMGCSSSQVIIVNVNGTSVTISDGSIDYTGVNASQVIFNLFEATSLDISNVQAPNILLAPSAAVTASSGQGGQMLVDSITTSSTFTFSTELSGAPTSFTGCPQL